MSRRALLLTALAAFVLAGTTAAAATKSSLVTRCSVAGGAAASVSSTTGPVSFNYPRADGPTAAYADAATQTLRGFARAERGAVDDDCTADASFRNTVTVAPGTSGLALGAPVTLRLTIDLGAVAGLGSLASEPFLDRVDMSADYSLEEPRVTGCGAKETCGREQVAHFGFGLRRIADASSDSLTHELSWGWQLSSNAADLQQDSADATETVCATWPCSFAPFAPFSVPFGTRTIELAARVGLPVSITSHVNTFVQARVGRSFAAGDLLDTLHAALAPAPGFEAVELVYGDSSLAIGDASVQEGNAGTTTATFPVTLSQPLAVSVTVPWGTDDGTATTPDDYVGANGQLTFAPGETSKTVTVNVSGDTTPEPDETFTVTLTEAPNTTIDRGTATGTIIDDDGPPPPSGACIVVEPKGGVDFGTGRFSTPGAGNEVTRNGTPDVTVMSCADATEQVSVHATDAAGGGASWTLGNAGGNPCAGGANVFGLALGGLQLGKTDKPWDSLAVGASKTATAELTMPCTGSGGTGETLTAEIVFTASSS